MGRKYIELQNIGNVFNASINIYTGEMIRKAKEIKVKGLQVRNKTKSSSQRSIEINLLYTMISTKSQEI